MGIMTDLEKYNQQLQIEHELINRKLTWLLSSQSILFASLAFMLGKDVQAERQALFFKIVSWLGIGISLLIFVGVLMAVASKVASWQDYNRHKSKANREPMGVRNWITAIALMPDIFMPIAFVVAWWWIWKGMG